MSRLKTFLLLVCAVFLCAACRSDSQNSMSTSIAPTAVKTGVKPQADHETALIEFADNFGTVKLELYSNLAPQMVARFKELATSGFYNNTKIHRIDPKLGIIQTGDPNSKNDDPADDGVGGSGKPNVPAEFSDVPFEAGIVGAARTGGNVNSANCQFFMMTKRQPAFEAASNRYTVFGKVIEGQDLVNLIANAPTATGTRDRPAEPIIIKNITIQKK